MGLPELRAWVQANGADPIDPTYQAAGRTTLADAIREGHTLAVHECLTRIRPGVQVPRGVLTATEFNAEFTVAMRQQLTAAERTALNEMLTTAAEINVNGPSVESRLVALGFPVTRAGSVSELYLGRQVERRQVHNTLGRIEKRREERLACQAGDVRVYVALLEDGAEVSRTLHPDAKTLRDVSLARDDMTEGEILRALDRG